MNLLGVARLYKQNGFYDKAEELLHKIIDMKPDSELAEKAHAELKQIKELRRT